MLVHGDTFSLSRIHSLLTHILDVSHCIPASIHSIHSLSFQLAAHQQSLHTELQRHAVLVDAAAILTLQHDIKETLRRADPRAVPQEGYFEHSSRVDQFQQIVESFNRVQSFREKHVQLQADLEHAREDNEAMWSELNREMESLQAVILECKLPMYLEEDFDEMKFKFANYSNYKLLLDCHLKFHDEASRTYEMFDKYATAMVSSKPDEIVQVRVSSGRAVGLIPRIKRLILCDCCQTLW